MGNVGPCRVGRAGEREREEGGGKRKEGRNGSLLSGTGDTEHCRVRLCLDREARRKSKRQRGKGRGRGDRREREGGGVEGFDLI